jgi:hypothetical protein
VKNLRIHKSQISTIRSLPDFDLIMLLSEINDHGWEVAKHLLPLMRKTVTNKAKP